MTDREQVVRKFLADSYERVGQLTEDLAALEPQPDLLRLVDAVRAALGSVETVVAAPDGDRVTAQVDPPAPARSDLAVVIESPLFVPVDAEAPPVGQLLVERGAVGSDAVVLAVMQQGEGDGRPLGEILVAHGSTTAAHVVDALERQAETKRSAAGRSVRVDVDQLDALERGVRTLAQTRDEIVPRAGSGDPAARTTAERRLDRVTDDLLACVDGLRSAP